MTLKSRGPILPGTMNCYIVYEPLNPFRVHFVLRPRLVNRPTLGGSWVATSGVISRVTIVITHIRGLITLLITTHNLQVGP